MYKENDMGRSSKIKHKAECTTYDVIELYDDWYGKPRVRQAVCTGYCGKDEFWGNEIGENGMPTDKVVHWLDSDAFIIIGRFEPSIIYPVNDLKEHNTELGEPCECKPKLRVDCWSIVHNSYDGREAVEMANEILNQ